MSPNKPKARPKFALFYGVTALVLALAAFLSFCIIVEERGAWMGGQPFPYIALIWQTTGIGLAGMWVCVAAQWMFFARFNQKPVSFKR